MKAMALVACLVMAAAAVAQAGDSEGREFRCSTSAEVRSALKRAGPGDSILLEGGRVYEIEKSFKLRGKGTEDNPIRFTSLDPSGKSRYAVITTIGKKKEPHLTAIQLTSS